MIVNVFSSKNLFKFLSSHKKNEIKTDRWYEILKNVVNNILYLDYHWWDQILTFWKGQWIEIILQKKNLENKNA